jgi:hypothetical protein
MLAVGFGASLVLRPDVEGTITVIHTQTITVMTTQSAYLVGCRITVYFTFEDEIISYANGTTKQAPVYTEMSNVTSITSLSKNIGYAITTTSNSPENQGQTGPETLERQVGACTWLSPSG